MFVGFTKKSYTLLYCFAGKRSFVREKIASVLKEKFLDLVAKYPQFKSCGSSLAAFVMEKGKYCLQMPIKLCQYHSYSDLFYFPLVLLVMVDLSHAEQATGLFKQSFCLIACLLKNKMD